MDFDFVENIRIKEILQRDYKELQQLSAENNTKSVIIIGGGLIESLLIDALVFSKELGFVSASRESLENLIKKAKSREIIKEDILSHAIRGYRNLVHAGKEIREEMYFDVSEAELALAAVKIIFREVKKWYLMKKRLALLEQQILESSAEEIEFFKLFTLPTISDPTQPEHPFLKFSVYNSGRKLTHKNILSVIETKEKSKEVFFIADEAVGFIENLIGEKLKKNTLTIHYNFVEASRVGGTGGSNRMIR